MSRLEFTGKENGWDVYEHPQGGHRNGTLGSERVGIAVGPTGSYVKSHRGGERYCISAR